MNKKYAKSLVYVVYTLIIVGIFTLLFFLGKNGSFQNFINKIESSSFDLRQSIISKYKTPSSDIKIIAIDDATYEYIMNNYGSWPITRRVWSDVVEFVEKGQPKNIIFDLLFIKPDLNDVDGDNAFVESIKKYNNVYLSMNFDNYDEKIRKSPVLEEKFKLNIDGNIYQTPYNTFINSRQVMQSLSNVTDKIGSINVTREPDGVIRYATPVFIYKNDYFPHLSLKVAMDLLGVNNISVKDNKIILDKNHVIPIDSTQRAILNWYSRLYNYEHIPLWEVLYAIKENNVEFLKKFDNKIIYIGTTAVSLSDIKTVPTTGHLAGVELHATFLNNVFDNNFIKKTSVKIDFIISILLSLFVGYFVLRITSVAKTIFFLLFVLGGFFLLTNYLMLKFNLWIGIVLPYISTITIFVLTYCEKYILKSKDYEQTYKLAVTDGLTQLYNHRYFQEQMINNVNNYKRYGNKFSLILIDIDFFKKFNDTYGHQSGDCVLKQVAQILKKNSRTSDIVCRYGGEEMAIILTNTNKEEAVITANKVCLAVRNNKFILANNEKVNVTISVGVATVGDNGEKPQEIIEFSDKCLYIAKENGRNQVVSET